MACGLIIFTSHFINLPAFSQWWVLFPHPGCTAYACNENCVAHLPLPWARNLSFTPHRTPCTCTFLYSRLFWCTRPFYHQKWLKAKMKAKVRTIAHVLLPCLLCSVFSVFNPSHHWLSMDRSVDDPAVKPQAFINGHAGWKDSVRMEMHASEIMSTETRGMIKGGGVDN